MNALLQLFVSFLLIGLGAYGGGLVTIPLIQHELVNIRHWLTFQEMSQVVALAQMTPGPIAINAATFVGWKMSGLAGASAATLAVILPGLLLAAGLAPFLDRIRNNAHTQRLRMGIQLGVLSLILFAIWAYGASAIHSVQELMLAVAALLLLVLLEGRAHPLWVILGGGLAGLLIF